MQRTIRSILIRWLIYLLIAGAVNAAIITTIEFVPLPAGDPVTKTLISLAIITIASFSSVRQLVGHFRQSRRLPGHC